jgi:hypothetical protein
VLLGIPFGSRRNFTYRAVTVCGDPFAWSSVRSTISYSLPDRQIRLNSPTTPATQRLPAITRNGFSLFRFRSPLLTESRLLSLPVGNEMFHFPTFPPLALCVQARVTGHDSCRVSPFGNPRITARLAAPRGLSQPPTSFIGSWCQGIHRAPLLTWPQRCSRPLCSSQETGGSPAEVTACVVRRKARRLRRTRSSVQPGPAATTTRASSRRNCSSGPSRGSSCFGLEVTHPCGQVPSGPNSVLSDLVCSTRSTPEGSTRNREFRRPK